MSSVQIAPVAIVAPKPGDGLSLEQDFDLASRHACLIAEYNDYMAAAGFSTGYYSLKERRSAARSFLRHFPDPDKWLELPVEQQLRCPASHHPFVHYLFLRHLLPMPAPYILAGYHQMCEMAIRLVELSYNQKVWK